MADAAQLPLDLRFDPRFGHDDFLVSGSNADAWALLARWPQWPGRTLLLVGPEGSGKSHLSAIWAERAAARLVAGEAVAGADPRALAEGNTVIEDADRLGRGETVLFHALNLLRESGAFLLMTARSAPDQWSIRTGDLLSRLRLAPVMRLGSPEDDLVRAVLVKLFLDRQLLVDDGVVDYIALRIDRSLGAARAIVDRLDQASLARRTPITKPAAARIFADTADP